MQKFGFKKLSCTVEISKKDLHRYDKHWKSGKRKRRPKNFVKNMKKKHEEGMSHLITDIKRMLFNFWEGI